MASRNATNAEPDPSPNGSAGKRLSRMTDEHKAALAVGRDQGAIVRRYLDALAANKPKRGRRRTQASIEKRLAQIEETIGTADPLTRLNLAQERMDLTSEHAALGGRPDTSGLEAEFVKAAKPYAERKGITYAAFREVGVDAAVLKRAGISRGQLD